MEKQVSIIVAGSDQVRDVVISPGASVREVMDTANLEGYQLMRPGGDVIAPDADLFMETRDFEKLYASPRDISVGEGGFASLSIMHKLMEKIENLTIYKNINALRNPGNSGIYKTEKVRLIKTRALSFPAPSAKARLVGERQFERKKPEMIRTKRENPYWKSSGWKRSDDLYAGYYETEHGKWHGLVIENYRGNYSFYIFDPPKVLINGSHSACFTHKGNSEYLIHFSEKPEDIDSGILAIEQLITKSFEKD